MMVIPWELRKALDFDRPEICGGSDLLNPDIKRHPAHIWVAYNKHFFCGRCSIYKNSLLFFTLSMLPAHSPAMQHLIYFLCLFIYLAPTSTKLNSLRTGISFLTHARITGPHMVPCTKQLLLSKNEWTNERYFTAFLPLISLIGSLLIEFSFRVFIKPIAEHGSVLDKLKKAEPAVFSCLLAAHRLPPSLLPWSLSINCISWQNLSVRWVLFESHNSFLITEIHLWHLHMKMFLL